MIGEGYHDSETLGSVAFLDGWMDDRTHIYLYVYVIIQKNIQTSMISSLDCDCVKLVYGMRLRIRKFAMGILILIQLFHSQ
jgi:hypothetical protein